MTPLVRRHAVEDTARQTSTVPAALLLLSDVTATAGATQNTPWPTFPSVRGCSSMWSLGDSNS